MDGFHDFENNCFPKYKNFNFAILFFFCLFLPSLPNYRSNMTLLVSVGDFGGVCFHKNVFKDFVMNLLASTPVFFK